jgi:hypothetical protein
MKYQKKADLHGAEFDIVNVPEKGVSLELGNSGVGIFRMCEVA